MTKTNLLILFLFQFAFGLSNSEPESFYLLRLNISETEIKAEKIRRIPDRLKTPKTMQSHVGDIIFFLTAEDGDVLYKGHFHDPRMIHTEDLRHDNHQDKKHVYIDQMVTEIKFPHFELITQINFFKQNEVSEELVKIDVLNWEDIISE